MALISPSDRVSTGNSLNPFQIAHNPLFTAREKIELLQRLKAEVRGAPSALDEIGFSPDEIDDAIAEVRERVQNGESEQFPGARH